MVDLHLYHGHFRKDLRDTKPWRLRAIVAYLKVDKRHEFALAVVRCSNVAKPSRSRAQPACLASLQSSIQALGKRLQYRASLTAKYLCRSVMNKTNGIYKMTEAILVH